MDGFALGGGAEPVAAGTELAIEGDQAAGSLAARGGSGAFEIMTGARMPDGLDRVIPVENTERLDNPPRVRLNSDVRSEEHTSELQSRGHLVCRLLLEKKKTNDRPAA